MTTNDELRRLELETAQGDLLQADLGEHRLQLQEPPRAGARTAAANTLAAYLGRLPWEVPSSEGECVTFRLNKVLTNWPVGGVKLDYPSASIDEGIVVYTEHSLVPTPLECTYNVFQDNTMLWKSSELGIEFQVDFFANDEPTRDAIEAGLPRAFSPTEVRAGVLLAGDACYFKRPVRATLISHQRFDGSADTYSRERRIRATIRADIDVVHLRRVNTLRVEYQAITTE